MAKERTERDWSCFLHKLLGGDRFTDRHLIDWPFRPGTQIGLRLLSDAETEACELAAQEYLRGRQLGAGNLASWLASDHKAMYSARYAREVLFRALVHPETGQPVAESVEQLSTLVSRAEVDALTGEYSDYAESLAPAPSQLQSEEEFAALAKALRGPFDETLLSRCRPSTLRSFVKWLTTHWQPRVPAETPPN